MTKPTVPKHLKTEARQMWTRLLSDFTIDDGAGLALLQAACESFQRAQEARAILDKAGAILTDRFGQQKVHPACAVERDAKASMIAALRALRLAPDGAE